MKRTSFTKDLTSEDVLDITLHFENYEIKKFALNYRAIVEEQWHQIYRVDNYHGLILQFIVTLMG